MNHEQAVGHLGAAIKFHKALVTLQEIMQLEVDATKAERRVVDARAALASLAVEREEQELVLAGLATSVEQQKAIVQHEYRRGNKVRQNADARVEREQAFADRKIEVIKARVGTAETEATTRLDELGAAKRAAEEGLTAAQQAHTDFIASLTPEGPKDG